jgi:ATP-dependent Lon protease
METHGKIFSLSDPLPVLPVRNTVVFPNTASPLVVGRPKSIEAVRHAQRNGDVLLVVAQKDGSRNDPEAADLHEIGVVCLISKIVQTQPSTFQLVANSLARFRVLDFSQGAGFLAATGEQWPDLVTTNKGRIETMAHEVKKLGLKILGMLGIPGSESVVKLLTEMESPEKIADLCCSFLSRSVAVKQAWLEDRDLESRLDALLDEFVSEKEKITLQNEIQARVMARASKEQRDHYLREQLRTIHEELGDEAGKEDLSKKIEEAGLSAEAAKVAKNELGRLSHVPRSSPEYHVIRTYLDWLIALPWNKFSGKDFSLAEARAVLEADHFGLEKVKSRIAQFLAVRKLRADLRGPILCLVGPPGVGKTSLGRSIAKALGREFIRASLGGVRDEAEIRGHRRTYIGALPGRIIQSLKRCGTRDPVMLLDEIDKVGNDFRGDPASALLEVLDPEQNHSFLDHYLDVPFDLSRVFFVTTANTLDTIPSALRDRLEIVEIQGYSQAEKLEIAIRHVLPRLLDDHGMKSDKVRISRSTIEAIINDYTRESGVRNLSRQLAQVLRFAAERLAADQPPTAVDCTASQLENILGPRRFFPEALDETTPPGIVTALAWTPTGGEILHVEIGRMEGKGSLMLTGQLGDVMKESAQIALSLLRSQWGHELPFRFEKTDLHIHFPAGAVPKDGPSAGAALYLALASLIQDRPVDPRIAVTGEITLRGQVLPVGGIKEKVLAAHRAGVRHVILPRNNQGDLREVPLEVREQLRFHFVKDAREILSISGLTGKPDRLAISPPPDYQTGVQSEFTLTN